MDTRDASGGDASPVSGVIAPEQLGGHRPVTEDQNDTGKFVGSATDGTDRIVMEDLDEPKRIAPGQLGGTEDKNDAGKFVGSATDGTNRIVMEDLDEPKPIASEQLGGTEDENDAGKFVGSATDGTDRIVMEDLVESKPTSSGNQTSDPDMKNSTTIRYEPEWLIGCGGTCEVYKAVDMVTKTPVAVKHIMWEAETIRRTQATIRELKILRHLQGHENIIKMKDVLPPGNNETLTEAFVVFELMGIDLMDLIYLGGNCYKKATKFILFQILRGLRFMHLSGVIHRDLKPENIVLNHNFEVRITDFGLARATRDASESLQWTLEVVSRWYRAPELLVRDIKSYSCAIDIWSVGCIMAELLNGGKALFGSGRSVVGQLCTIVQIVGPVKVDTFREEVPAEWQARFAAINSMFDPDGDDTLEVTAGNDPVALDLLRKLLEFDPKRRISATAALNHEYFAKFRHLTYGKTPSLMSENDFEFEKHSEDFAYLQKELRTEIQHCNIEEDGNEMGALKESSGNAVQFAMKACNVEAGDNLCRNLFVDKLKETYGEELLGEDQEIDFSGNIPRENVAHNSLT